MSDRRIRRGIVSLIVLGLVGAPFAAAAQSEPPPVAPASPVAAPQPMRFLLTDGNVIIGTEAGRDAESVTVSTSTGLVRIPISSISSMDYNTAQVAAPTAPIYPQVLVPPPRRRRPGRGLIIAGSIVFGLFYALPALITVATGIDPDSDAGFEPLVLLPVAGPFILAAQCDDELEGLCRGLLVLWGIGQIAGGAMLIAGIAIASGSRDDGAPQAGDLDVLPLLARDQQGLALRGTF